MTYQEHIVIDPRIRGGKPCIRGTRITLADIQACFAFAAARDRRFVILPDETAVRVPIADL